jgi:hypothetical protein
MEGEVFVYDLRLPFYLGNLGTLKCMLEFIRKPIDMTRFASFGTVANAAYLGHTHIVSFLLEKYEDNPEIIKEDDLHLALKHTIDRGDFHSMESIMNVLQTKFSFDRSEYLRAYCDNPFKEVRENLPFLEFLVREKVIHSKTFNYALAHSYFDEISGFSLEDEYGEDCLGSYTKKETLFDIDSQIDRKIKELVPLLQEEMDFVPLIPEELQLFTEDDKKKLFQLLRT